MQKTDLLCEEFASDNNLEQKTNVGTSNISRVVLDEVNSKKYHKKPGIYYTIYSDAILKVEKRRYDDLIMAIARVIKEFMNHYHIEKKDPVFVVGIGNNDVTPDSLGPKVIDMLLVTSHLMKMNKADKNMQNVIALSPGVMAQTGIETVDIISSVCKKVKPKLVIVIDALAARSMKRLNKTIQLTNSGIAPGAGIGNKRAEISKETIGVDVVALGVPTVVDIRSVIEELQNEFLKDGPKMEPFAIEDENIQFMVTPKEIDQNIIDLAHVISDGLNLALHDVM